MENREIESYNLSLAALHYGRAIAFARIGEIENAISDCSEALTLNPDLSRASELIAELQKENNHQSDENVQEDSPIQSLRNALDKLNLNSPAPTQETAEAKSISPVEELIQKADLAIARGDDRTAFDILIEVKALKEPVQDVDLRRAEIFIRAGQQLTAKQSLLEELRYFPSNTRATELLNQLDKDFPVSQETTLGDSFFQNIYRQVRSYTMLSEQRLYSLYSHAKRICEENIPGNFVECGVAAGGSSALLAATIKQYSQQPRFLYSFDSFDGMPEPGEFDMAAGGVDAQSTGWGTGTCAAPESSLIEICTKLGVANLVNPIKGYFEDTLPVKRDWVGMIAFLHLDGDWYDSTKAILYNLYERVVQGGFMQVSNYGHWTGCKKAIHNFNTEQNTTFKITDIDGTGVWISKEQGYDINPELPEQLPLIYDKVDPVKIGTVSQMCPNERFQLFYTIHELVQPFAKGVPINFIEIGSFSGASVLLMYMTMTLRQIPFHGWSVEPGGTQQFHLIIAQLKDTISHVNAFSDVAAREFEKEFTTPESKPRFIFVDGDHTYEGVRKDIENYYPLLADGGYIIFHDWLPEVDDENRDFIFYHHGGKEPGIRQAVQELMIDTFQAEEIEIPLLYPNDPTQTQAHLPLIPKVFSTVKVFRK